MERSASASRGGGPGPTRRRRRWRRAGRLVVVAAVVLLLGLLVYGLLARAPGTGIDSGLAGARPAAAPRFELPVLQRGALGPALSARLAPTLADGRVGITELRGSPVVLNFWASWCVPCRTEAPLLERSWRAARAQGVVFVGLDMQDLIEDARAFMREYHNSYLNIRDQTNAVARRWGVTGIPETFFVSPRGRVVARVIGVVSPGQMRRGIAASRSGQPAGALQGGDRRPTR